MDYDAERTSLYLPHLAATVFDDAAEHAHDWVCAELSRLAYTPFHHDLMQNARLLSELKTGGFEWVDDFHTTGAQAIALRLLANGKLLLVFSGYEPSFVDFATDRHAAKTPWPPGGQVHLGCAKLWADMWPAIQHRLGNQLDACIFTGHSMGAALATLAASQVQSPLARLVTTGSPAVGDAAFATTIAGMEIDRYVNCCDVICTLPPPHLDYVHVGALRYIDSAGEVHTRPPQPEEIFQDQNAARFAYGDETKWLKDATESRDLADHAPINYVLAMLPIERESALQGLL
jgi:Lipase (class 3)